MSRRALIAATLCLALLTSACGALTQGEGAARSGWFRYEAALNPATVNPASFGKLYETQLDGEIYAQPVMYKGVVVVVTENNQVAGVNADTGQLLWSRYVGAPWQAADLACYDLAPNVGITGTPVIEAGTSTVFFVSKHYASGTSGPARQQMHAVDLFSGAERPGFPVTITGAADNDPSVTFDPTYQLQRPGLLLDGGVVYAAFGGHCDREPYNGWVIGVSTTGRITTRWAASTGPDAGEAGIWHSGGGIVSDRAGSLLVVTGNGPTPGDGPGARAGTKAGFGQSVVRLTVGGDGKLRPTDFFTPVNADALNRYDGDVGAGGPTAIPDELGTPAVPHLLAVAGKEGYIYVLDRDRLGGRNQASGGGDAVVAKLGMHGGVWSKPASWPGDGGWLYVPTASPVAGILMPGGTLHAYRRIVDGTGKPTFVLAGESSDVFGFGSSAPLVTSDGVADGSALVWVIRSATGTGDGGELRAYDPVPVDGTMVLRWSAPIGRATKFAAPAIFGGRIYVPTRDGKLIAFGATNSVALQAPRTVLPASPVGTPVTGSVTVTAQRASTLSSISATRATLAPGAVSLPARLRAGQSLTIPVTFTPDATGPRSAELALHTDTGTWTVPVVGRGTAPSGTGALYATGVSFPVSSTGGRTLSEAVIVTNTSTQPVSIDGYFGTPAPFTTTGLPPYGRRLAPGESFGLNVTFTPPATVGSFSANIYLATAGQLLTIPVTAETRAPGLLALSATALDAGAMRLGTSADLSFTVTNSGDAPVTVTRSKPPVWDPNFRALTSLPEGIQIPAHASWTQLVRYTPSTPGPHVATWEVNGDDGAGIRIVTLTGTGLAPPG